MIIVNSIEGKNGSRKPESIPDVYAASFSDDQHFYFFESQAEYDAFIAALPKQEPQVDYLQLVRQRKEKGALIMDTYLADNAAINLTMEQSIQQLQKFQVVKSFLEVGNLEDSKTIIQGIATDEIFTQERKDKYLSMFP